MKMLFEVERLTGQAVSSSILFEATTIRQLAQQLSKGEDLQPKPLIQYVFEWQPGAASLFPWRYKWGWVLRDEISKPSGIRSAPYS